MLYSCFDLLMYSQLHEMRGLKEKGTCNRKCNTGKSKVVEVSSCIFRFRDMCPYCQSKIDILYNQY